MIGSVDNFSGTMMRVAIKAGFGLALGLLALTASAQDNAMKACSVYVNDAWQPLGKGALGSCLKGMDRWVTGYNEHGFKFSAWGTAMLSADRYYFYRSDDAGAHWKSLGLKSELVRQTDAAADLPSPGARKILDTMSAEGPTPATQPKHIQPSRRACSLRVGGNWKLQDNVSLTDCAALLDRSPDTYDSNGYKYAYWSGVFLAADAREVFQSDDSNHWQTVLQRAGAAQAKATPEQDNGGAHP